MEEQASKMEEQKPKDKKEACCSQHGFCYCKAIAALLIIVLVWLWTPSWANIAITVLAALIIAGSCGCCCRKKGSAK